MSGPLSERGVEVESLCTRALEGTLNLEDFYREWPGRPEKGSFLESIYDDIEDGVQHAPGTWIAGKIDLQKWKESWEYLVICLDLQLLRSGKDPDQLLELRNEILSAKRMSLADMQSLVAQRLSKSA